MVPKKLKVEVGTNVYRDVSYSVEFEKDLARVHMTYDGTQIEPLDLWPPIHLESEERAEDLVMLWARWLYDDEKKRT